MKSSNAFRTVVLATLCLAAGTASAHPGGHPASGFLSGLAHPLLGLDHLLVMLAIGVWAAQQGGRALWAVPLAWVGGMLAGFALAGAGWVMPWAELAIVSSLLVFGLLLALRRPPTLPAAMAVAAGFALFHGHVHGLEMPQAASSLSYGLGFVLASLGLHGAGIAIGLFAPLARRLRQRRTA
jgi:urease accessory protein